ncbi:hypothetical protein Sjap_023862 [Stephania japonica]|uniref:Protein kinase domain-containing protein n=1 Tax=Stephania japonica TaxID=461633 RepID=A0AAP0ECE2_9MAGN
MTNILYFHGVVRDDSSSVDTNSEASRDPADDPDASDANLFGKNLSKLVLIPTFAKGCLNFGRSVDLASSSGVKGDSKVGSKIDTSKSSVKALPSSRFEGGNDEILPPPSSEGEKVENLPSLRFLGASTSESKTGTSERSVETHPSPTSEGLMLSSPCLKTFTFRDLKSATRNFGPDRLLGNGGSRYVFKGWLDKQTLSASKPGTGMIVAEVNYLGWFRHQNLIKLIGYCSEDEHRLLVYEFMPKGCVDYHLFRRWEYPFSWDLRIKVAIGVARVLSFFHNLDVQVSHRHITTSNILLDKGFNPKLSSLESLESFRMTKSGPTGDATLVSTGIMCTYGYVAPKYVATGNLTAKSDDVYSFGVVLLELLSGRRAIDMNRTSVEQNLVAWAKPYLCGKQKLFRVMDSRLEGQYPKNGARMAAALALRCLSTDAKFRPTMAETLTVLERISDANNTS